MQGTAYEMGRKRIDDYFDAQNVLSRCPTAAETRDQYIEQQLAKFYGTGFNGDPNCEASKHEASWLTTKPLLHGCRHLRLKKAGRLLLSKPRR